MKNLIKNIFIIFLCLLNIAIIIKLQNTKVERNLCIKQNIELNSLLGLHKEYIKNNSKDILISFDDILEQISPTSEQINKGEIFWVVMIPQNVCMSCVSSLFSDLANLKSSKENLHLIQEQPIKSIEREWQAYHYKNYSVDSLNKIFSKHNFNGKIILAKLIINEKKLSFFHYESELHEYLDYFVQ